ncbi:CGNR zinc finger domain-containing protein [Saccharomonospora sp. NPDC046836]|uniref:CGNR zinc finger domain-containing protein n=1 Tax=Saccharomonospora sp. NPDC046836 TaxID=3156921 RepID=UPI0033D5A9DD
MDFNPYGGAAARVAAAVVNAGRVPAADLAAIMSGEGSSLTALTEQDAACVADWAQRLRPVFTETDLHTRVELLNTLLADSACRPYISRHDGKPPHLHYAGEGEDPVRRIQAYTVGGLAHLLCEDPDRIGVCLRQGCGVVFVDTSRNGRRRYCSTRCATRVHVAEHRERQRR